MKAIRSSRLEGLGTWTKAFQPKPVINEQEPLGDQLSSVKKQYIGLFHELTSKVEKLLQMQEAFSDLEEELKAHRSFQEKGFINENDAKLLAKRAFAETQAVKLRAENER